MADSDTIKKLCPECKTLKKKTDFYKTWNTEKYPEGVLPICKKCRTMMVDNWNPETFLSIFEEVDVPFVPSEYNIILEQFQEHPEKCGPTTMVGKYIGKMQMIQWRRYRWKDSEELCARARADHEQFLRACGVTDPEDIKKGIEEFERVLPRPSFSYEDLKDRLRPEKSKAFTPPGDEERPYADDGTLVRPELVNDYFAQQMEASIYDDKLTSEDKDYLRLKWGNAYSIDELVRLEKLYKETEQAFDIQTPSHRDTLVKACKASLKSDQLLDLGDVENSQKMINIYEKLMKMGNFTAVQNKVEQGEVLDSISELVLLCEREGFIPRYYTSTPKDKVDETLADMNAYVRDLIESETNLESMIEDAVKQIYTQENRKEDTEEEDEENKDLTLEDIESIVVEDKDFTEYKDFLEQEESESEAAIKKFLEELDDD